MTEIFVFGSNLAGRHGKGGALYARKHYGALQGVGEGLQGSSYAIPTKDSDLKPLPLADVQRGVATFLEFAAAHPAMTFRVTAVGCGLAGFEPADIAPMFRNPPANCILPDRFLEVLRR